MSGGRSRCGGCGRPAGGGEGVEEKFSGERWKLLLPGAGVCVCVCGGVGEWGGVREALGPIVGAVRCRQGWGPRAGGGRVRVHGGAAVALRGRRRAPGAGSRCGATGDTPASAGPAPLVAQKLPPSTPPNRAWGAAAERGAGGAVGAATRGRDAGGGGADRERGGTQWGDRAARSGSRARAAVTR